MNPRFARYGAADVRRLIAEYPLAWMIAPGAPADTATLLPMIGRYDDAGGLTALIGHMSRRRPLRRLVEDAPRAHFLFTGPQGYVSSEHSGRRDWGPTWNYAAVRIEAEVRFDAALTPGAVAELIAHTEAGSADPWHHRELRDRYHGMLEAIIGFEAQVTALDATFKLAQDEDDAVLRRIVAAHPDAAMRRWIRALNRDRLADVPVADEEA